MLLSLFWPCFKKFLLMPLNECVILAVIAYLYPRMTLPGMTLGLGLVLGVGPRSEGLWTPISQTPRWLKVLCLFYLKPTIVCLYRRRTVCNGKLRLPGLFVGCATWDRCLLFRKEPLWGQGRWYIVQEESFQLPQGPEELSPGHLSMHQRWADRYDQLIPGYFHSARIRTSWTQDNVNQLHCSWLHHSHPLLTGKERLTEKLISFLRGLSLQGINEKFCEWS